MNDIAFAFRSGQLPLWALVGVALLAGIVWLLRRLDRVREARLHRFVESGLAPRLLEGYDARLRRPLFWFTLLGAAMLLLTFAQPHWGQSFIPISKSGRDILFLLDLSESMNAANPAPSRLVKARQKIESLIERMPADRVGLVAFSGNAALQCPLTLDHGFFRSILDAVDTDTLTEEGTDIEAAFDEAQRVFEEDVKEYGAENREGRAIVLISDGEQVSGDAVTAARRAGSDAAIYVMGIGDPNGAVIAYPELNRAQGVAGRDMSPHLSKLDEETLAKIATESGGIYVRATPDDSDVARLTREMENLAARAVSGEVRFSMVNRYRWPLTLAFACFALEGLWLVLLPHVRQWRMTRAASQNGEQDA